MMSYERCWAALAGLLGAAGIVRAYSAAVTLQAVVAVGLIAATVTCLGACSIGRQQVEDPGWRTFAAAATLGAVGGIALTGLFSVLGGAALLAVAVLVVGSPPALRALARHIRRVRFRFDPPVGYPPPAPIRPEPALSPPPAIPASAAPAPAIPPVTAAYLSGLTDAELCWAWRTSYTALQALPAGTDLERRTQLVAQRQQYLDELERRNPAGFRRWLYTGARPASDPTRYVVPARGRTIQTPDSGRAR